MACKTIHSLPLGQASIYSNTKTWSLPVYAVWAFARWSTMSELDMWLSGDEARDSERQLMATILECLQRAAPNPRLSQLHLAYYGANFHQLLSLCVSRMPALRGLDIRTASLSTIASCLQLQHLSIAIQCSKSKSSAGCLQLPCLQTLTLKGVQG